MIHLCNHSRNLSLASSSPFEWVFPSSNFLTTYSKYIQNDVEGQGQSINNSRWTHNYRWHNAANTVRETATWGNSFPLGAIEGIRILEGERSTSHLFPRGYGLLSRASSSPPILLLLLGPRKRHQNVTCSVLFLALRCIESIYVDLTFFNRRSLSCAPWLSS